MLSEAALLVASPPTMVWVRLKSIEESCSTVHLLAGPDISGGENMKLEVRSPVGFTQNDGLKGIAFSGCLHDGRISRAGNVQVEGCCKSLLLHMCCTFDPVSVVHDIFSELNCAYCAPVGNISGSGKGAIQE